MNLRSLAIIIIVLAQAIILRPAPVSAQSSNVWTFGINTGLDFNKDPVEVIHPKIWASGACASFCDDQGQLLLYTDGVSIYNRYYDTIMNGALDDSFDMLSAKSADGTLYYKNGNIILMR